MKFLEQTVSPDEAFLKAMTTEGLERFDVLREATVAMYNAKNYHGMERLMDLCLGTGNRGYVRTMLMTIKPVRQAVSDERWDRLVEFLSKGNREVFKHRWIPVEERMPDMEDGIDPLGRAMSKPVLVDFGGKGPFRYSVCQYRMYGDKTCDWSNHKGYAVAWMEIE